MLNPSMKHSITPTSSPTPLINLIQKRLENICFETPRLIHRSNLLLQLTNNLFLILIILLIDLELIEDFLDFPLRLGILSSVVFIKDLTLLRRCNFQCNVNEPGTFIIEDVGADFPGKFRITITIYEIVLN